MSRLPDPLRFPAVLFDMDGTLVDSEGAWFEAERVVAARHGVALPEEARAVLHGLDADAMMTTLVERYGLRTSARTFFAELVAEVERALASAAARPGAEGLVRRVAAAQKPRAVVSNSPHAVIRATLDPHPWSALLPVRVSVEDVPNGKPAPDAYLEAAARLGVDAATCLAIEDSLAGARAAVAAGATCLFVTHGEVADGDARALTPHVVASLTRLVPPGPRD
jgi:HAD superfamily hydrolase (TIGR01509 family)